MLGRTSGLLIISYLLMQFTYVCAQSSEASTTTFNIGVLAFRGHDLAIQRWEPTAQYLSDHLPYSFKIVPLTNDDIATCVEQGSVDFVLTNPASFVGLESRYGIRRLATLLNAANGGSYASFGAVIFTRHDRDDIKTINDITGKYFMAVHRNAFGGWWMAKREFLSNGIDPENDFADLVFVNFPQDQIAYAVQDGIVDAGTMRSSVLERMTEAGHINLNEFKILNPQKSFNFHHRHSTRLYPEWPFSAVRHVPMEVARQITLELLNMKTNSEPARAARIKGWTSPLDYQPVYELMRELQVGQFSNMGENALKEIVSNHRYMLSFVAALFLLMLIVSSYVLGLNRRYMAANKNLEREIVVRGELEEQLKHQALHDALTNLPNRKLFLDRVHHEILLSEREQKHFSVAIIDLDKFKVVNDEYGHGYGDILLVDIANRFIESVRKTDTIARIGGDEFVLLIDHSQGNPVTLVLVEKLLHTLQEPFSVRGETIHMSASIGIAIYPEHGDSVDGLMRHADLAMYKAKQKGNCIVTYDSSLGNEFNRAIGKTLPESVGV